MCGIVGYWSETENAFDILLNSLKKLEYRGYDSFGFATLNNRDLMTERKVGKISDTQCERLPGNMGIGHTRWATHGKVNEINSHPHKDCSGKIAVVHNGIIENFKELRDYLEKTGHTLRSETDTEILAHLLEEGLKKGMSLKESVIRISNLVRGRNSFVALSSDTGEMIASRNGSPLILGITNGKEVFIASDIPAFLDKTKKVTYLDDGQICCIGEHLEFYDFKTGNQVQKRVIEIDWKAEEAELGDYKHFMLKEIMEQKETLISAMNQNKEHLIEVAKRINGAKGVFFIGCGTAARVCHIAEYVFSKVANKHINYITASEFENYEHFLLPETLVIAVSQSGETADVLDALNIAKRKGCKIISILNNPGSSMERISDYTFPINAGPEKAVASTKATTSQIAVVILLAYACIENIKEADRILLDLSGKVNDMLNPRYEAHIGYVAKQVYKNKDIFIIGRGINYPLAIESAIKLMEVSYIHAQGFAGGELKHGPIALIEKGTPVIALIAEDKTKEEILSNAMEVKSRGAIIIGVSPEKNEIFDYWIKTPKVDEVASVIANLIPIQLLSYNIGILRGYNVDYPRNLAKSVTVR
ncbi:MAG: glutamine--fructose-6-phosphate transaminase (isomerizing) [archaeon]|nr:glutamine--fructose-6-phosphate transaminase (isomerizing) [archaeon]MCR4323457.1 glutamine--fructose-6-phosphate transaminase (isomerizing) [Nanoarchaeota archaeon]